MKRCGSSNSQLFLTDYWLLHHVPKIQWLATCWLLALAAAELDGRFEFEGLGLSHYATIHTEHSLNDASTDLGNEVLLSWESYAMEAKRSLIAHHIYILAVTKLEKCSVQSSICIVYVISQDGANFQLSRCALQNTYRIPVPPPSDLSHLPALPEAVVADRCEGMKTLGDRFVISKPFFFHQHLSLEQCTVWAV